MLIVVEDGNVHPLTQLSLYVETLGRFDVLEYDATESGFEGRDNIHELFGVGLVDF